MQADRGMARSGLVLGGGLAVTLAASGCGGATEGEDAATSLDASVDAARSEDAAAPLDAGPALRVASVVDLGVLPLPSDVVLGRDGTSSGVIGGRLLWTFGDAFMTVRSTVDDSQVVSASGAWASVAEPLVLEQAVDSSGVPAQLIPFTEAELAANRADIFDGWALWPGAVIDTGAPELLVLFQRIKRTDGMGFDGVGLGTARLAPGASTATRDPDDLFSRPMPAGPEDPLLYGPGGVSVIGDTVYFFACDRGECSVARAPRARADERAAFEFYDGEAWVADIGAAVPVIRNVAAAHSVTWNAHLGRYLSVTSAVLSNDVVLRTAEHVEGPWPASGVRIAAAEGGILPAGEQNNYLAQEHVALASPDGREIVISYSRPMPLFRGEVRLARITLE